jgi:CubicO group peptidase (beta-lactamase class C family)
MKTNYLPDNSNHDSFFRQITEPQVDALVNKTLTAFNVPGIAVAIIKDGKVVLAKVWGEIHKYKRSGCYTLFGIASNSKALQAHP